MITKDEMSYLILRTALRSMCVYIFGLAGLRLLFFFGNLNISEVCDFFQIARISSCINFQQSLNLRYIVHKQCQRKKIDAV